MHSDMNKKVDVSEEFFIYKQSNEATIEDLKRKIEYNFRKVCAHEVSLNDKKDEIKSFKREII